MTNQIIVDEELINKHFSDIAPKYSRLRTTDPELILDIKNKLYDKPRIDIADVGCGDGRYSLKILNSFEDRCFLYCVDNNEKMLKYLEKNLLDSKIFNFSVRKGKAERLPLKTGSLDCVLTFNAIQHFNIFKFLNEASRILKTGGKLFIYTRLRNQNSRNIWGKYFPWFKEIETRLYELNELKHHFKKAEMKIKSTKIFGHHRSCSLERLLEQAQNRHYSTFSLFSKAIFEESLKVFEQNIRDNFEDMNEIKWYDENILFEIRK